MRAFQGSSIALAEPQRLEPAPTTPRDPLAYQVLALLQHLLGANTVSLVTCQATMPTTLAEDPGCSLSSPWC